jgi:GNAT superfamily N-acetyltransferase
MASSPSHLLRAAEPRDVAAIVGLIRELAEFEKLSHLCQVSAESLAPHLFGDKPVVECVVGEVQGEVVAFALFFPNFSTFLAKPGLYLEDLYIQPAHRGNGLGKALLEHLAALAVERGCGRFEWCVLDWNERAIRFYEGMGATVMPDWRLCRISGERLVAFAKP